jgi:hypothetical protein
VVTVALWAKLLQLGALTPEQSVRAIDTILRSAMAEAALIDGLLDRTQRCSGEIVKRGDAVDVRSPPGHAHHAPFALVRAGSPASSVPRSKVSRTARARFAPESASGGAVAPMRCARALVYASLTPLLETDDASIDDGALLTDLGLGVLDLVLVALELEDLALENGAFPMVALAHVRSVGDLVVLVEAWSERDAIPSSVGGGGRRRSAG